MKYVIFLCIGLLLAVSGCSSEDNSNYSCRLTGCRTRALYYHDKVGTAPVAWLPGSSDTVRFEYGQGRILKSYGGHYRLFTGTGSSPVQYTWWPEAENHFNYAGDTVQVAIAANSDPNPDQHHYVISSGEIRYRKSTITFHQQTQVAFEYEYLPGKVIEKRVSDGGVHRTFYISEQGNLERVEYIQRNQLGEIMYTKNLLFSEYDNTPNPLRGMFHIEGAFYAAFSNNVAFRTTMTISPAQFPEDDGVLFYFWHQPVYGPDGFPAVFQRECE